MFISFQPVQLMLNSFSLSKPGNKLPSGTTEIPFVFKLQGSGAKMLYETYHGVFINIQYFLKVEMKRGLLAKDVEKSCEFIVEYSVSNLNRIRRYDAIIHKPLFIIFYYVRLSQKTEKRLVQSRLIL